jgi:hypothetical protein
MPIITDIGSIYANSYCTTTEASAYFQTRSFSEAWDEAEDQDKLLVTATNNLDWFIKFPGQKVTPEQALQWPRKEVYDKSINEYIATDIIPRAIKLAIYELVLVSIDEDRLAENDLVGIEQVQIGSLKIVANTKPWQENKTPIPPVVYKILSGIIDPLSFGPFSQVMRF